MAVRCLLLDHCCMEFHKSLLGPLLYLLYNVELGHRVASHGVHLHQYADNGQVYIHVTVSNTVAAAQSFAACISDINDWMRASTLRLNPSKTRFL